MADKNYSPQYEADMADPLVKDFIKMLKEKRDMRVDYLAISLMYQVRSNVDKYFTIRQKTK